MRCECDMSSGWCVCCVLLLYLYVLVQWLCPFLFHQLSIVLFTHKNGHSIRLLYKIHFVYVNVGIPFGWLSQHGIICCAMCPFDKYLFCYGHIICVLLFTMATWIHIYNTYLECGVLKTWCWYVRHTAAPPLYSLSLQSFSFFFYVYGWLIVTIVANTVISIRSSC